MLRPLPARLAVQRCAACGWLGIGCTACVECGRDDALCDLLPHVDCDDAELDADMGDASGDDDAAPDASDAPLPVCEGELEGGSPIPEFDIRNFAEVQEQPCMVISPADALAPSLAASAGPKMDVLDAACAAATVASSPTLPPLGLQQARGAVDALIAQAAALVRGAACPRCCFDLVPCESSGAACFACASLATPRSRAVLEVHARRTLRSYATGYFGRWLAF